jgi:hypothetical protein
MRWASKRVNACGGNSNDSIPSFSIPLTHTPRYILPATIRSLEYHFPLWATYRSSSSFLFGEKMTLHLADIFRFFDISRDDVERDLGSQIMR